MNRLEQRCNGVMKVLDDYNIPYGLRYNQKTLIHIKNYCGRGWDIEVSNKYITVEYKKNKHIHFLPSFTGIIEFREFIKSGKSFMNLEEDFIL